MVNNFYPHPHTAIGSDDYKKALAEVNELGEIKSTKRTEDQTHIAQFYKQDAELTVNEACKTVNVCTRDITLEDNALIFALVDIAEADADVSKYRAESINILHGAR